MGSERDYGTNIADMGFGYSQLLPILVQAWASKFIERQRNVLDESQTSALVIEQPELHLHPDFQAKLSDIFVELLTATPNSFPIIVETHSQHLINRVGELIAKNKISKDDVGIVLVENSGKYSSVRNVSFDDEGYLQKWPYGFFDPDQG